MKYYFSFTSIPSRFEKLNDVIISLLNQSIPPEGIFIHIPVTYRRFGSSFTPPSFPQFSNVFINQCPEDYGSNTKFIPMLQLDYINNDVPIIIVDDDCIQNNKLAETLLDLQTRYGGDVASCMFGITHFSYCINKNWEVYRNSQNIEPVGFRGHREGYIDIFEGFGGVCLKKKFFTTDVFNFPCEEVYYCDDVWLSGHVLKNNFKIVVSGIQLSSTFHQDDIDALKNDVNKQFRDFVTVKKIDELFQIFSG